MAPIVCNGTTCTWVNGPAPSTYQTPTTQALDQFTALATGSTTPRTLASWMSDVVNVKAFGARGDGVTDDATAFAAAAAVVNAGSGLTLYFPDGTYNYSGGLVFTKPVKLVGGPAAVLNYTGSSYAVKLGPDGLNDSTYQIGDYVVSGLKFAGGAAAEHGIYVNVDVVSPKIEHTRFENFGPTAAGKWAVYFAGANWRVSVFDVTWWNNSGARNFMGMANDPNTKFEVLHVQASQSSHSGQGILLNGWNNSISHSKIEGFTEGVILGSASGYSTLDDVYIESFDTTGNYGGIGYDWAQGVTVSNCYFNGHSNDLAGKGSFLYPRSGGAKILNSRVNGNRILNLDASAYLVKMNALAGQTGNTASDNVVNDVKPVPVATTRSYAAIPWYGSDGDLPFAGAALTSASNTFTQTNYFSGETYFQNNTHYTGVAFFDAYTALYNGKTLTGYSDAGSTSKFVLDPSNGSGSFTGALSGASVNVTTGGSTTISTGVGSVKMSTANPATNVAWIPIKYNGTTYYIPAWTTNAP